MKAISTIILQHVISEPGDAIRYDYAYHNNADEYYFVPINNSFSYPQHINFWDIKNTSEINGIVKDIAKYYDCNIHTVMECIRTIQEDRSYKDEKYTEI